MAIKHTHTRKFGCERITTALVYHFPVRQGNCPTLPDSHNVTLSTGKRVRVGRGCGRWGGGERDEERKTKTKETQLKKVLIVGFSESGCPAAKPLTEALYGKSSRLPTSGDPVDRFRPELHALSPVPTSFPPDHRVVPC